MGRGMARKTLTERRAEKLNQLNTLKRELAQMEEEAGKRFGKLAIRAGLADIDIDDAALLKEFQAIAARFRGSATVEADPHPATNGTGRTSEEAGQHGHA